MLREIELDIYYMNHMVICIATMYMYLQWQGWNLTSLYYLLFIYYMNQMVSCIATISIQRQAYVSCIATISIQWQGLELKQFILFIIYILYEPDG